MVILIFFELEYFTNMFSNIQFPRGYIIYSCISFYCGYVYPFQWQAKENVRQKQTEKREIVSGILLHRRVRLSQSTLFRIIQLYLIVKGATSELSEPQMDYFLVYLPLHFSALPSPSIFAFLLKLFYAFLYVKSKALGP